MVSASTISLTTFFVFLKDGIYMLGCLLCYETPSYEVHRGLKYLKSSSSISAFEFQWLLIISKKGASWEMINNLKTCQSDIPILRRKYLLSWTDQRHHFCDKITLIHFIERMDLSQQSRTADTVLIHIP